jgi:hypothetical protein
MRSCRPGKWGVSLTGDSPGPRAKARGRLLSHLAIDEALNEPGIDLLTLVAVVDAVLLDDRLLAV